MEESKEEVAVYRRQIVWKNVALFTFYHALTVYCLVAVLPYASWLTFLWIFIAYNISMVGVVGGVHRLWSHRSFKAKLPLRILLMLCFSFAGQNSIFDWARDHRSHHKFSDTDADPHNPSRGFFFAHFGWLMLRRHPDVIRRGRQLDVSDLEADPVVAFQKKYHKLLKLMMAFLLPTMLPLMWGESLTTAFAANLLRYILSINAMSIINSVGHAYGTKPYDRKIAPVNNFWVSFVLLGEGWHNFHHAFPWDYKTSEIPVGIDVVTHMLHFFKNIGWAYDLRQASPSLVREVALRHGDGSFQAKVGDDAPSQDDAQHGGDIDEYTNEEPTTKTNEGQIHKQHLRFLVPAH